MWVSKAVGRPKGLPHDSPAGGLEIQEHYVRQTDAGARGERRLQVLIALFAFDVLDAAGRLLPVDGRAQAAQVLEKELAAGRVAAQTNVLARYVGQRVESQVGPIIAAAAADHGLFVRHAIVLA